MFVSFSASGVARSMWKSTSRLPIASAESRHVVQPARQVVDVLAVDGCDERAIQAVEDVVGDEISVVLDSLEIARAILETVEGLHHVVELIAPLPDEHDLTAEQAEEVLFFSGIRRTREPRS
jgi:hypothetical protein